VVSQHHALQTAESINKSSGLGCDFMAAKGHHDKQKQIIGDMYGFPVSADSK
jgi:hypothetical protein